MADYQVLFFYRFRSKTRKNTTPPIGVIKLTLIMKKLIQSADSQQGWVKLQRSTLDTPMMKNPILLQIYVWSILKANHQSKWFSIRVGRGIKEIYCDVGQFITGRNKASDLLGASIYCNTKLEIEKY